MGTEVSDFVKKRIKACLKFNDETYYLQYRRYFDVIAQVHSIVFTVKGFHILRCWRGTLFGPANRAHRIESNLFRVRQETFQRYLAPPDPRIGKAVEELGEQCLMEITVYDDHIPSLMGLKSGDFLALQNVHLFTKDLDFSPVLHGGTAGEYHRGISVIPEGFDEPKFLELKHRIEHFLRGVTDFHDFEEFVTVGEPPEEREEPPEEQEHQEAMEEEMLRQEMEAVNSRTRIERNSRSRLPVPPPETAEQIPVDTYISTVQHDAVQDDVDQGEGPELSEEEKRACMDRVLDEFFLQF